MINKKVVWAIVVVALLLIGTLFFINSGDEASLPGDQQSLSNPYAGSEAPSLTSDDEVFSEIDATIDTLE